MSALQGFAYYRVDAAQLDAVLAALRSLHLAWTTADPALQCELLQRDQGSAVTLMEIYRHADGLDATTLQQLDAQAAAVTAPWRQGERQLEVFTPCA